MKLHGTGADSVRGLSFLQRVPALRHHELNQLSHIRLPTAWAVNLAFHLCNFSN